MIDLAFVTDKIHPREKHFYLQFLGVDPDHQGRGLGTALMRPVLERCDREGCGAYLENSNAVNTPYYKRMGFKVTGLIDMGNGAPALWPMWREPQ